MNMAETTENTKLQATGRDESTHAGEGTKSQAARENEAPPANGDGDAAASDTMKLDLVMDVELNVTLRFGQRQLTLREVLDLSSGSVVELDRHVEEPIELLLDGRVIARGEAVVVDGNYGLRVSEVAQPASVSAAAALRRFAL